MFRRQRRNAVPQQRFTIAPTARQIVGNLMVLQDGTILAGYRIGDARWDFMPNPERSLTIESSAETWAALATDRGRRVIERVTSQPFPVAAWARALDMRTAAPLPDVHTCADARRHEGGDCGCPTWNRYLTQSQHRIIQAGQSAKIVYRYIEVGKVSSRLDVRREILSARAAGLREDQVPDDALRAALREQRAIANIVTAWGARPMSERQQAWLRMRCVAPGILPRRLDGDDNAIGWDASNIGALVADTRWTQDTLGRHVDVTSVVDGKRIERAVQVVSVARMSDLDYPNGNYDPWQTYAERAVDEMKQPFAVEWAINGEIVTPAKTRGEAGANLRLAKNLSRDYEMFEEEPPRAISQGIFAAKRRVDEMDSGRDVDANRFRGTIDAIVIGEDILDERGRLLRPAAEVVEERAAALRRLYNKPPLRIDMAVPSPQWHRLAATIPGEPQDETCYQREMKMDFLAAGLPNASATVGDGRGPYLGYTRGAARRAVMHDPHFTTEGRGELGRGNNMWVLGGALGSGKSYLIGAIAYPAARRGTRVVIRDPSGPLSRLAEMPELAPHSQVINLLEGEPGILNPCALIREPRREDFGDERHYNRAVLRASAERRSLLLDFARRCLTVDLYAHPELLRTLANAARDVHWTMNHSPWHLVEILGRSDSAFAKNVAAALKDASHMPLFALAFPEPGFEDVPVDLDATLTVISTPGVRRAPDDKGREDWNDDERGADAILTLSSFFMDRFIYGKPRREDRCIVVFDEAEDLTDFGAGRGYLARLGRDHSKWNTAVYLSVKSLSPHMFSGELRNFLAGAFAGRMADEDAALPFLDILNIRDRRYARTLLRQSRQYPGEFVHLDALGRPGAIRVDVGHLPALAAALKTDPEPVGSEHWSFEVDDETVSA